MTKKSKIIKIIGEDNCADCAILFNLINECIKAKNLDVEIKKIRSISNEALDLAVDFDINTIPFAIFKKKKIVFNKNTSKNDIEEFVK